MSIELVLALGIGIGICINVFVVAIISLTWINRMERRANRLHTESFDDRLRRPPYEEALRAGKVQSALDE